MKGNSKGKMGAEVRPDFVMIVKLVAPVKIVPALVFCAVMVTNKKLAPAGGTCGPGASYCVFFSAEVTIITSGCALTKSPILY
jgi:hypothetical protein